jgi:hypothetical protein
VRVRCLIVVGLIALTACGSSSGMARHRGAAASCGRSHARTLAADTRARVYESANNVYGCAIGGTRSYLLGASARSIREGRAGPIALAGVAVAYGYTVYGVDTLSTEVVVRSLRTGRELHRAPATTRPVGPEFFQAVAAIVVKPDGAVAWIGEAGSVISGRARQVEVDRADHRGVAMIDSGGGIDNRSLRLRGSTVTWRDHGRTRSARLD